MLEWDDDLKVSGTSLFMDSRRLRPLCFVSHAHSDHIAIHERALATPPTAALLEHRLNYFGAETLQYGEQREIDCHTRVQLIPAGHVLGSAMLRVERPEGILLYTGDFKLRESLTVETAAPVPSDVLVMETTYGLPFFRFPRWREVADQLIDLCRDALANGRQPIVMGYSLGKAQEAIRILTDAGLPVTLHGAVHSLSGIIERFNVKLGPYRRYRFEDFHGPAALDLAERGVLIAPPRVARTSFATRFKDPCRIVLTGWALLKNSIYRYGVEHALPLSDHADFDELLELVDRVNPRKIYTHHGYKEFADTLRARGHDATLACPDGQMTLFGE